MRPRQLSQKSERKDSFAINIFACNRNTAIWGPLNTAAAFNSRLPVASRCTSIPATPVCAGRCAGHGHKRLERGAGSHRMMWCSTVIMALALPAWRL